MSFQPAGTFALMTRLRATYLLSKTPNGVLTMAKRSKSVPMPVPETLLPVVEHRLKRENRELREQLTAMCGPSEKPVP